MQTHADECRRTQTNADAHRCTQTNTDERKANYVHCVGGPNLKTCPDVRHLFKDFQDILYLKTYGLHTTDVHSVYIYMYMKNPQFDSLVWDSLILAPNTIRINFEIQKLTVRLAVKMWYVLSCAFPWSMDTGNLKQYCAVPGHEVEEVYK